jgi:hypothetical protein
MNLALYSPLNFVYGLKAHFRARIAVTAKEACAEVLPELKRAPLKLAIFVISVSMALLVLISSVGLLVRASNKGGVLAGKEGLVACVVTAALSAAALFVLLRIVREVFRAYAGMCVLGQLERMRTA